MNRNQTISIERNISSSSIITSNITSNKTTNHTTNYTSVIYNITDFDLNFHLCNRQVNSCVNNSAAFNYATLTEPSDATYCQDITEPNFSYSPNASYIDSDDSDAGVVLTFPTFTSLDENVRFVVQLSCNDSIPSDQIEWIASYSYDTAENTTIYTITGSGEPGCPLSLSKLLVFFYNNIYIFAVAFIVIGLFSLLGGKKFFNVVIFALAAVLVASISAIIIFELTTVQTTMVTKWVIFIICICIGSGAGYAAVKIERIGFFALGALLGALGTLFLYNTLLHFLGLSNVSFSI